MDQHEPRHDRRDTLMRIGMVCEAEGDHRTATTLASRALNRSITTTCINPAVDRDSQYSCWSKLDTHPATWPRHHLHGRWGTPGPCHGYTTAARKAIVLFAGKADALILMVDGDDEGPDRLAAMERARSTATTISPERIVLAVPIPEREAWHIAGFVPSDTTENGRLQQVAKDLGGDPRTQTDTLRHGRDTAKRNAKRILAVLCDNDVDRAHACVADTPLASLREFGQENGLADFLRQVETRLSS